MIGKIVSGGQTGVDRAALDVALELGLDCGGWCPAGRRAEDGPIPERYPLSETPTSDYEERSRLNVRDSDGTLILTRGTPAAGTRLTLEAARAAGRPHLVVDFAAAGAPAVGEWIAAAGIRVLNVAGPRASTEPGIYDEAASFLLALLGFECPEGGECPGGGAGPGITRRRS